MKKVHFISLGCPRNLSDTEHMVNILLKRGFLAVDNIKGADFIILNTCGFLKTARDEAFDVLDEIFEDKKKLSKVIVTGCMVNLWKEKILKKFPKIFFFLGSGDVSKILDAINSEKSGEIIVNKSLIENFDYDEKILATPEHLAYLKISEGCSKNCNFCLIPKIKGPLRSRNEENILEEFDALLKQGVFEINLIAQNLGDYGKDVSKKNGLENLLKKMLQRDGKFWIRLLYLYPEDISDELIEIMKSDSRICPYLDIPFQHVSDKILKSMNRKFFKKDIEALLEKLRQNFSKIFIRSSFIVGMPGETLEDFHMLLKFIEKNNLDNLAIFKYSREKGTKAFDFKDQVDDAEKERRFKMLSEKQFLQVEKNNKEFLGQKFQVIVDGYHPDSDLLMVARHIGQNYSVDSNVILNDVSKVKSIGKLVDVEIEKVLGYDLLGKISS